MLRGSEEQCNIIKLQQGSSIIIIIIISHGLSIYARDLLEALHTPHVIPDSMTQVSENVIPPVFVSSSSYVFG